MQESILSQGANLMLFGMGAVFIFLAVLVVVTTLMSQVVMRFFPEAAEPMPAAPLPSANPTAPVDAKTLKVIQAAIDRHRSR